MKIEGRSKGADYVHEVTACYREAIDAVIANKYTEEKKKIETDGGVKPKLLETNKTIEADLRKLGTSIKRKDIDLKAVSSTYKEIIESVKSCLSEIDAIRKR